MNGAARHFFEFDGFRVELEERRLLKNDKQVALTPRVFDILVTLLENAGQTVEKDELMQSVWADTFVEEGNLHHHVSSLRKILGDDPRKQRLIKTIPRRGYRFTANVDRLTESETRIHIDNVSRSRLVIKEKTTEGFWTGTRVAIAGTLLITATLLGGWAVMAARSKADASKLLSTNPAAVAAYENGRALWQTRKADDLHEATLFLQQAVETDPNFALAHAGLADAYAFDYGNFQKAKDEAAKAAALDPTLGEPYATTGFVRLFWEMDPRGAELDLRKAIELSPNYATGHHWYAVDLAATGHVDAALAEMRKAAEIDPASAAISSDLCQILYLEGKNDEALTQCKRTLRIDPGLRSAHDHLFEIYLALGMDAEAVDEFVESQTAGRGDMTLGLSDKLRRAFHQGGRRGVLNALADYYSDPRQRNSYHLAQIDAMLGKHDEVIADLNEYYSRPDFEGTFMLVDPVFQPLQTDARMVELQRRLLRLPKDD